MINTISSLSKVSAPTNKDMPARFNSSLPITIEVLKPMPMNRYKLLLGTKEFTTKSHKKLKQGAKYWGNFGENKGGIITISDLIEKPESLQNGAGYLSIESSEFFEEIKKEENLEKTIKEWILKTLSSDETPKGSFEILSNMLLALKEGIIHLPMQQFGKIHLIQLKSVTDGVEFFIGAENLGPMQGIIYKEAEEVDIEVMFNKSAYFLSQEIEKHALTARLSISKSIKPLYEPSSLILNIQG